MAFCRNCGMQIIKGAKFCQICGCAVLESQNSGGEKRKSEFVGKLYKCPNCGEVLKSFEAHCPACGLELRGVRASNSVREFALKLEAIEAKREYEKPGFFKSNTSREQISKTDEQKISLIRNFSVPNTKEDILEFMILATTNIDVSVYGTTDDNKSEKAMANAWYSKIEQVYAKAFNSYGKDEDFSKIENLYEKCVLKIKRQKCKGTLKYVLLFGWLPAAWIILIILVQISSKNSNLEEKERLNNVVIQIQETLENEEYKLALMHAESIEYGGSDKEQIRQWEINREYWIEKIISEAASHGVYLERSIQEENDDSSSEASEKSNN